MLQKESDAHVAALRELAGRVYRNLEARDGRVYWKDNAPRALRTWAMDVRAQSSYKLSDILELYRVLYELCGLVLDSASGIEHATAEDIVDAVGVTKWADSDPGGLLRWLQDDLSRITLVEELVRDDRVDEPGPRVGGQLLVVRPGPPRARARADVVVLVNLVSDTVQAIRERQAVFLLPSDTELKALFVVADA